MPSEESASTSERSTSPGIAVERKASKPSSNASTVRLPPLIKLGVGGADCSRAPFASQRACEASIIIDGNIKRVHFIPSVFPFINHWSRTNFPARQSQKKRCKKARK